MSDVTWHASTHKTEAAVSKQQLCMQFIGAVYVPATLLNLAAQEAVRRDVGCNLACRHEEDSSSSQQTAASYAGSLVPSMSLPPSSAWQRRKQCAGMSDVTWHASTHKTAAAVS
jgi:hypothetical protein